MRYCILYISSFLIFFPSFSFAFLCPNIPMCSPSTGVDEICNLHLSSSDTTLITVTRVDSDYTLLGRVSPLAFPYLYTPSTNNHFAVFSPPTGTTNSYRWRAKHVTSCPATCYDQLQNGSETAVDCGGNCGPCGCSNQIQDEFESGIDCGGTCSDECVTYCYGEDILSNFFGTALCTNETPADSYGNCPPGTQITDGKICTKNYKPILGKPGLDTGTDPQPAPEFQDSTSSTVTSSSSTWTPDPVGALGSGTESIVVTTTTTNSSGVSSTTTSTTNNYYSGDGLGGRGQLTGSQTSSQTSSTDPSQDPSNYDFSYKSDSRFNADIDYSLLPEAKTLDSFGSFVSSNNPVSVLTEDMKLTANGTCSFSLPTPYGSMSLDFCDYTWVINIMGAALVFCSYLFALFIIFA